MDKKTVIVTGASGGIGIKVVKKFTEEGYYVIAIDLNEERLRSRVAEEGIDPDSCAVCSLNITEEESVKETLAQLKERYGHLDALVNAAGICGEYNKTIDYSFDNFRKIYEVNVFGTFLMMKYALPYMTEQKKGAIVNFGSVSGMRGYPFEVGYGSSKWAVIGMTENVASEYGGEGVRCNSVSPGWVDTPMMKKTIDNYRTIDPRDPEQWISYGSIRRAARPEEIADAVYYLCSEQATFVNGTNLTVDGGMVIK